MLAGASVSKPTKQLQMFKSRRKGLERVLAPTASRLVGSGSKDSTQKGEVYAEANTRVRSIRLHLVMH